MRLDNVLGYINPEMQMPNTVLLGWTGLGWGTHIVVPELVSVEARLWQRLRTLSRTEPRKTGWVWLVQCLGGRGR